MPDSGNDRCVCCGCDTGIPQSLPVPQRPWYIEGSGQLCGSCYLNLYIRRAEDESRVTDEELVRLIRLCKNEDP